MQKITDEQAKNKMHDSGLKLKTPRGQVKAYSLKHLQMAAVAKACKKHLYASGKKDYYVTEINAGKSAVYIIWYWPIIPPWVLEGKISPLRFMTLHAASSAVVYEGRYFNYDDPQFQAILDAVARDLSPYVAQLLKS
jgi:hypothetical protein